MKKIIFAIAFVTMMTITANAQRDGFFSSYDNSYLYEDRLSEGLPTLPYGANVGGLSGDVTAEVPLGSGLLVLTAFGAVYAVAKRKKEIEKIIKIFIRTSLAASFFNNFL